MSKRLPQKPFTADRVMLVQLEQFEPPSAIEFVRGNRKWVNYGEDNDFLEELLSIYYGSPTHSAIVNGIADMIVGNGLTSQFASRRPDAYARAVSLFKAEDVRRWAFDLKCFGYFIMQIVVNAGQPEISHTPVENWRSGIADDKGKVGEWWFSDNWAKSGEKKYAPIPVPVYDRKKKNQPRSVCVVKPFRAGSFYYPAVDYMGALEYARLEKEVATFHLKNVMNGLVPGLLVNFNNGDAGDEERKKIEKKINDKWKGSRNAGRAIVAFNDNKEAAATVEAAPVTDLDKQYQFLSTESSLKIMIAHRVTSPLIFGIRAEGGLGNNANELTEAYKLFSATVLAPFRRIMTEAFEAILNDIGSPLSLMFRDNDFFNPAKPTGSESLAKHTHDMSEDEEQVWLAWLEDKGEIIDPEEWVLVYEEPVDASQLTEEVELASLDSLPQDKSTQDRGLYKVRYSYAPEKVQADSRAFCRAMVDRAKAGQVYRKEDIVRMGDEGVNSQFAAKGESTYSIWLYKGGVNCHHYWTRRVYFRKREAGKFLPKSVTEELENETEVGVGKAKAAGVQIVRNEPEVVVRPIDMPNGGRKNP